MLPRNDRAWSGGAHSCKAWESRARPPQPPQQPAAFSHRTVIRRTRGRYHRRECGLQTFALRNLDSDMPQYISDNTDDEMSHGRLSQRVPDFQRREARGPKHVSHSAEQPGDRGAGIGTADQPDEPQCGHQLVHPLAQHAESGSWGHLPARRQHRERTGRSAQRSGHTA